MAITATVYKGYTVTNGTSTDMVFVQQPDGLMFWADSVEDAKREIDCLLNPTATAIAHAVENDLVTEEYCHICSRVTDHGGEHSMQQLIGEGCPEHLGRS